MKTIGSSIICMDHLNFRDEVKICEQIGVDYLHIDVMDGAAVPRYGVYPELVRAISDETHLKMDLHLMVSDVQFALSQFKNIENIEYVSFHYEHNRGNVYRIIDAVRDMDKKPILALNLDTNINDILTLIEDSDIDGLLFMGIHPGVLSQKHRPGIVLNKMERLKRLNMLSGLEFIQCDGGVNFLSLGDLSSSGINNFVCGTSTLYKDVEQSGMIERKNKIKSNFAKIKNLI